MNNDIKTFENKILSDEIKDVERIDPKTKKKSIVKQRVIKRNS